MTDPRPDMTEDSGLWDRLLTLAEQNCPDLAVSLTEMRRNGTRLIKLQSGGYGLRPQVGKGFWESPEAYKAKAAELLKPHHEELTNLLGRLAEQLQQDLKSPDMVERAIAQLDVNGLCAVKSSTLNGEVVWFVRDQRAATMVRKRKPSAVVYTLPELQVMVNAVPRLSADKLRQMHQAKRIFGGTIGRLEQLEQLKQNNSAV